MKKVYMWSWDEENNYDFGGDTIKECLEAARKDIFVSHIPYDFIELLKDKMLLVFICTVKEPDDDGFNLEAHGTYSFTMSGNWRKLRR